MPSLDPAAVAANAAGITDAFGSVQTGSDADIARFDNLTGAYEGWAGVVVQIAEAGEVMERFRVKYGMAAAWGRELPFLYDVWDSIAEALWTGLGHEPLESLVEAAIERAVRVEAA